MKLIPIEIDSPLWSKLRVELELRLETLRKENDGSHSHDETQKLRGRIAEVKTVLAWADTPPVIE
jgi:hypothetical protein